MGRALAILLIFVVVGPLIGLVTLSVILTAAAASQHGVVEAFDKSLETGNPVALGVAVLTVGALLAHFFGALWAALAGAIVAIRTSLWGPASVFEGVPIGVFTAMASIVFYDIGRIEPGPTERITAQLAGGWALVHIIPAMVCIWLTRRWQTGVQDTS